MQISSHIAKTIADRRLDKDLSQSDLEREISSIINGVGILQVLRDFVAINISIYRGKTTLVTLTSQLEDLERQLRLAKINTAALDKSKISKLEQLNGRTVSAEELFLIAIALKKPITSFFPAILSWMSECDRDPFAHYDHIDTRDGIREYRHQFECDRIAVVYCDEGIELSNCELEMYL